MRFHEMRCQLHTHDKTAIEKRTLPGKIKIDATHHENHEPWLQVGAPDVSQRFQPPWWSPGWCPLALHFVANCPSFFFLRTQHSRREKVDLTLSRLRALNSFPLFSSLFYLPLKFDDANERTPKIIVVERSAISGRIYSRSAIFIVYAIVQKNANPQAFLSLVVSNWRISSRGYFINY